MTKEIGLRNIFRNFLWEKKNQLIFFNTVFYISYESAKVVSKFFLNNLLKIVLKAAVKMT